MEEEEAPEPERGFAERLAEAAQQPEDVDEGINEEADMAMEIDEDDALQEEREETDIEDAILASKPTIKLVQVSRPNVLLEARIEAPNSRQSPQHLSQ